MPGPTINWKTLDTEAWRTQIDGAPPARYKLANPRAITGSPCFAMQGAGQQCVVRIYIGAGAGPDLSLTVSGTTLVPMTNVAGGALTAQELADLWIEVGMPQVGSVLLTTDEPNGSPSNPYPSTEARNAAVPSPPNAVAWVAGDPVPTPYMLANGATGAADGDWVEMSGGSSAVAYGDLT